MTKIKICIYCGNNYQKDTEHVFPHGLGGQKLYMDCVCEDCNSYFSGLERELYQKSFVGLLRSIEGVSGYKPSAGKKSPFKAPILLTLDEVNNMAFEVGQYHQMQTFIRPQIIIADGEFYLEGDTQEGVEHFVAVVKKWRDENLTLVVKGEVKANYKKEGTHFSYDLKNEKTRKKGCINFCSLPETHELYQLMEPRLFFDDEGALKIRAKNLEDAIKFLLHFLNRQMEKKEFNSFKNKALDNSVIYVGFDFNGLKLEQALMKIGLNCLFYYYPESKTSVAIADLVSHVKAGSPGIRGSLEKKDMIIDHGERLHNVFFQQHPSTLMVRLSLFSGRFVFCFWIDNLIILREMEYTRLIIRFDERINILETQQIFLASFK